MASAHELYAVIVAGGQGLRFGSTRPKQFMRIHERDLFQYSLDAFLQAFSEFEASWSAKVLLVLPFMDKEKFFEYYPSYEYFSKRGLLQLSAGGESRAESVRNGILDIYDLHPGDEDNHLIMVHDAARPLFDHREIYKYWMNLQGITPGQLLLAGRWSRDTVLQSTEARSKLLKILRRNEIFLAETPQGFYLKDYLFAMQQNQEALDQFTDESSLFLETGMEVLPYAVDGPNIKITYRHDFEIAKMYLDPNKTEMG